MDFIINKDIIDEAYRYDAGNDTHNYYSPIKLNSSQFVNITTVNSSTYDLNEDDYILHVTYTSTSAVTSLTLPTEQTSSGRKIIIKDAGLNAAINSITIDTEGSETIDGSSTLLIDSNGESVTLYSDGSNWFII
jgi:hypothetical protein